MVDMSARKTYRASAVRDGDVWLLDVPEIERVTQARRLDQAERMVRSLVSIMTGEAEDSFDVAIQPELDSALSEIVLRAVSAKGRAAAAQAEASNLQREAVRRLTESAMTIRDAGDLLGITHQRVAQLLASKPERPSAAALADALGGGDRPVDVYSVRSGHRRITARQAVNEVRETGTVR
jgi:hypothetical protein